MKCIEDRPSSGLPGGATFIRGAAANILFDPVEPLDPEKGFTALGLAGGERRPGGDRRVATLRDLVIGAP